MKAFVIKGPGQGSIQDVPNVNRSPEEVLLEPIIVGLCGTDRLLYSGKMPMASFPRIPCHETVARVLAPAEKCSLEKGQLVCVDPYLNCGSCYACHHGKTNCCRYNKTFGVQRDGVLREQFTALPQKLFPIPDNSSLRSFAFTEPLALALHIVNRPNIQKGDWILVVGIGNVGQLVVTVLQTKGAKIIAWDISKERLAIASKLGVSICIDANDENAKKRILEVTDGEGVGCSFEISGSVAGFETCIHMTAFGGQVVVVGHGKEATKIKETEIVSKELTIFGSRNSLGQFPRAIRMIASGIVNVESLISREFKFEESLNAFEYALQSKNASKILINM
ncbi:MAG: zinc-binding dehydrogenase [Candidatus Njordarchaeales archaeon]